MPQQTVRCTNCGTSWTLEATDASGVRADSAPVCPVCHLPLSLGASAVGLQVSSIGELEAQLDALVNSARASGLDDESIVRALREELAFAAEMGNAGRRFSVALIDLGPQESKVRERPARDRREILQSRSVSQQ